LIGFGAGAIAGAGAALLLAPASGKETTAAIRDKWDNVSDKVCDVCGEAKSAITNAYEKTAAAVGNAKERLAGKQESSKID
jgi:gas vesicle protein